MFKSYSSKAAANKGATRMGYSKDDVYQDANDAWGFDVEDAQPEAAATKPQPEVHPLLAATGHTVNEAGATVPTSKTGRKIEKDRPMQNGVKMPSAGTKCREVWDYCASLPNVDAKAVKAQAEAQGWNPNNASIEYYNWRKYMGIHGRAKKQAAA